MIAEAKLARRYFIKEISELVDQHSCNDNEKYILLEKFFADVLRILDGRSDTEYQVLLTIGAFEKDILSGNLQWYFQMYQEQFAPIVKYRKQKDLMERLH